MIAHVVPILRLRRDTSWWSYKVPAKFSCVPGSLVVVPFRGRDELGIVWEVSNEDEKAKESLTQVVTTTPLVKKPSREFVEWLSEKGLCSLSTALYVWLPSGLRELPLTKTVRAELENLTSQEVKQQAIVIPGYRPAQQRELQHRLGNQFGELFADGKEEIEQWFKILRGEIVVGMGREKALCAPWSNLTKMILIEPEDISYYHEQIPYLNLVDAAKVLVKLNNAELEIRSGLPEATVQQLWNNTIPAPSPTQWQIELVDLRKEPLLNTRVVEIIKKCLTQEKRVLVLYNAHDTTNLITRDGVREKVVQPGIETVAKRLAHQLGLPALPPSVVLGTRSILSEPHQNVGATIILSLDPLLSHTSFANFLHGIADINRLFRYPAPCLIQTHQTGHALVQALTNNQLEAYLQQEIQQQKNNALPPFGQHIVCSYPDSPESAAELEKVRSELEAVCEEPWQISHPFPAKWRKKMYHHILLHTENSEARIPVRLRKELVSLPRPWRVQRDPWYLL